MPDERYAFKERRKKASGEVVEVVHPYGHPLIESGKRIVDPDCDCIHLHTKYSFPRMLSISYNSQNHLSRTFLSEQRQNLNAGAVNHFGRALRKLNANGKLTERTIASVMNPVMFATKRTEKGRPERRLS